MFADTKPNWCLKTVSYALALLRSGNTHLPSTCPRLAAKGAFMLARGESVKYTDVVALEHVPALSTWMEQVHGKRRFIVCRASTVAAMMSGEEKQIRDLGTWLGLLSNLSAIQGDEHAVRAAIALAVCARDLRPSVPYTRDMHLLGRLMALYNTEALDLLQRITLWDDAGVSRLFYFLGEYTTVIGVGTKK